MIFMNQTLRNILVLSFPGTCFPLSIHSSFYSELKYFLVFVDTSQLAALFWPWKLSDMLQFHHTVHIAFKLLLLNVIHTHSHSIERLSWWDYYLYCHFQPTMLSTGCFHLPSTELWDGGKDSQRAWGPFLAPCHSTPWAEIQQATGHISSNLL